MNKFTSLATSLLISAISISSYAVDLDAGDYDTAPAGTNLALLYLQHANRDKLYSGSDRLPDNNELTSNIGIARFVHYTDIAGYRVAPQVLIPFGQLEADQDIAHWGESKGLGDIVLAAPIWLLNDTEKKQYFGITPYLFLPTGEYDEQDALNLGENRYKLNLQVAYSTRITPQFAWDVSADATFYGDNDDLAGGGKLKQDVGYQLQTNGRYFLNDRTDLRAGLSYSDAGDTEVRGVDADGTKQSKFWLGAAYSPTTTTNVLLTYGRDIDVENGFKEDNRVNFRLLKVF